MIIDIRYRIDKVILDLRKIHMTPVVAFAFIHIRKSREDYYLIDIPGRRHGTFKLLFVV